MSTLRRSIAGTATAGTALAAAICLACPAPASAGVISARIGDSGGGAGYGTRCEYPVTAKADGPGYVVFADWLDAQRRQEDGGFPTTVVPTGPNGEATSTWRPSVPGPHTLFMFQQATGAHVELHVMVTRGLPTGSSCFALPF